MRAEIIVRGSIVGTRKDLKKVLVFAAEGKVKAAINGSRLNPSTRCYVVSHQVQ
jgi:D-arabinose 1-dehydrogenase-like Zn-dependent alcohol dehydrogenase